MVLKAEDTVGDLVLGSEVSGREGFALQDREVDLDLVHPARVRGQVHQGEIVELCLETVDGALAAVNGAAVDDPEDASGRMIGFSGHNLGDERVRRVLNSFLQMIGCQSAISTWRMEAKGRINTSFSYAVATFAGC